MKKKENNNENEFWNIVKKIVERRIDKENGHKQKDKSERVYTSIHA